MSHVLLGPVVGHTDHASTRIWIRVDDDPSDYKVRVRGHSVTPFFSTEQTLEFGTAIAEVGGLRPDWEYHYRILRRSRTVPGAEGTFRTMPLPGAHADVLFVSLSCSHRSDQGAWALLQRFAKDARPRFAVMLGDQIYLDDGDDAAVYPQFIRGKSEDRRKAIVKKYQEHWSREPLRTILANTPTYMMWDDHEIMNGWGSFAPCSPSLKAQYSRGATIVDTFNAYFEDCRDVYWHFQGCRNPGPPAALGPPSAGTRTGLPFFFQCGRLAVLVLDDRGARDLWRAESPVLGTAQWQFLGDTMANLSPDADALAVVVPLPLVSMSPTGHAQEAFGERTDDVDMLKAGDEQGLIDFGGQGVGESLLQGLGVGAVLGARAALFTYFSSSKRGLLSDTRDAWAHQLCLPEQVALLRKLGEARFANRLPSQPRELLIIGGDVHAGALFDLSVSEPEYAATAMVTSGISKRTGKGEGIVGIVMDDDFDIADGIHAHLRKFTNDYNFGVTQILFGAGTAVITNAIAHAGDNSYWSLKLSDAVR